MKKQVFIVMVFFLGLIGFSAFAQEDPAERLTTQYTQAGSHIDGRIDVADLDSAPPTVEQVPIVTPIKNTPRQQDKVVAGKANGFGSPLHMILSVSSLVFISFCLQRISKKYNKGVSWHAWIPVGQIFLMGEFAGIRPLWLWLFLLIGIPALSFVLVDLASFFIILAVAFGFLGYRMAIGLNKPGWLGALAAVPIVNLAVFGYFAFFAE